MLCFAFVPAPSERKNAPKDVSAKTELPLSLLSRKHQVVRTAIWDVAIDLFAKNGFDETTVDEIAQAAGVSRRSFFRYFSSKNDLMGENMLRYGNAITESIAACPPAYPPLEVLRQTVLKVASGAASDPRTLKIMQIAAENPAARVAQLSRLAEVQERVAEAFAPRLRKRPNNSLASRLLAGMTVSILDVTFRTWFGSDQPDISIPARQAFTALQYLFCEAGSAIQQTKSKTTLVKQLRF